MGKDVFGGVCGQGENYFLYEAIKVFIPPAFLRNKPVNCIALYMIQDNFSQGSPVGCLTPSHHHHRTRWPLKNLAHLEMHYQVTTALSVHVTPVVMSKRLSFFQVFLKLLNDNRLTFLSSPKSIFTNDSIMCWKEILHQLMILKHQSLIQSSRWNISFGKSTNLFIHK